MVRSDGNNDGGCGNSSASRLQSATIIAEQWIRDFSGALSDGRIDDAVDLFAPDPEGESGNEEGKGPKQFPPFWRDMVAYTWNIVTLEGRETIRDMLRETLTDSSEDNKPTIWKLATQRPSGRDPFPPPLKVSLVPADGNGGDESHTELFTCEFWCDIETVAGTGYAHVRLDLKTKRASTLLTTLLELHETPFRTDHKRSRGSVPGPVKGREYFQTKRQKQKQQQIDVKDRNKEEYHVAIVGAGQAGLSLAARLEAMGVSYVLYEAGASPGSSWRDARYPSLHLHDPVWYQHMPYMEFPKTWPVFTPKDKLAGWLDAYAKLLDLNIRTNTKVVEATEQYDSRDNKKTWQIKTIFANSKAGGRQRQKQKQKHEATISAKHVVFATGNSSRPKIPNFSRASSIFRGIQLHTSQYKGGQEFAGKRIVVIGSNNSGFDICQDLWEQGASSVTMIQRTGGMIVSSKSVLEHGLFLFTEDPQYHYEDADLILTTTPYRILVEGGAWKAVTNKMKETDAELIARVEAAGYKFDYGYDGTGLFSKSATEGGGFYIDVGCAELLARKDVLVRYADVERFEPDAVVIKNKDNRQEEHLPADVVVYATGFETIESHVEQICGQDIVERVGKTWGLGLNYKPDKDPGPWTGELRNMWKPTNVEGLWFHGGNLAQCRHYSKFLALQLAARYCNEYGEEIDTDLMGKSKKAAEGVTRMYGIPPPAFAKMTPEKERPASVASPIL